MKIVETPESYYYNSSYDMEDVHYSDCSSHDWLVRLDFMFDCWLEKRPEWVDEQYAETGFDDVLLAQLRDRFETEQEQHIQEEYFDYLSSERDYGYDD